MDHPSAQSDPTRPITPVLSLQSLAQQIAVREIQLAAHRQQMPVITSKENEK
jgi:hypothetical protein